VLRLDPGNTAAKRLGSGVRLAGGAFPGSTLWNSP